MAANGEIELTWGDGEHKFNIAKLKCVLELEEKCNAGIAEVFQRIQQSRWKFNDIRETLRLGLIGAGTDPQRALALINRYCDDRPWAENVLPAQAVLIAAMIGVPEDPLGKKQQTDRAKEELSTMKTESSSDPLSTESGPLSDSTRAN